MRWIGRVVSLLVACIVVPVFLFFAGAYLVGFGILVLVPLIFGSFAAAGLVAIPGLIVFDRTRATGRRPALLLGGTVGLMSGVFGGYFMWRSDAGPLGAIPFLMLFGIPYGLLGVVVYWYVNGWFENLAARLATDRALAQMSAEDRRDLGSRLDRDSW